MTQKKTKKKMSEVKTIRNRKDFESCVGDDFIKVLREKETIRAVFVGTRNLYGTDHPTIVYRELGDLFRCSITHLQDGTMNTSEGLIRKEKEPETHRHYAQRLGAFPR